LFDFIRRFSLPEDVFPFRYYHFNADKTTSFTSNDIRTASTLARWRALNIDHVYNILCLHSMLSITAYFVSNYTVICPVNVIYIAPIITIWLIDRGYCQIFQNCHTVM
jgi:hypothetical protein